MKRELSRWRIYHNKIVRTKKGCTFRANLSLLTTSKISGTSRAPSPTINVNTLLYVGATSGRPFIIVFRHKKRRCKKKRNKARGFPRYGSSRALIYHTAKKNYLILKKGYSKHSGTKTAFLPIIKMLKNIFFRLLF